MRIHRSQNAFSKNKSYQSNPWFFLKEKKAIYFLCTNCTGAECVCISVLSFIISSYTKMETQGLDWLSSLVDRWHSKSSAGARWGALLLFPQLCPQPSHLMFLSKTWGRHRWRSHESRQNTQNMQTHTQWMIRSGSRKILTARNEYGESSEMQLLGTNGKSTPTGSGPDVTRESLHFGFCSLPKANDNKWVTKSGHPGKMLWWVSAVSGDLELCHQAICWRSRAVQPANRQPKVTWELAPPGWRSVVGAYELSSPWPVGKSRFGFIKKELCETLQLKSCLVKR